MSNRTMIDIDEFCRRAKSGERPSSAVRLATSGKPEAKSDGRTISFVFSDGSVDRMGDTIDARGWVLDEFLKNPVALFGHDAASATNVIGRAKNVRITGDKLKGDIEFMDGSVNPNADIVFQMVKGGFLNATSVGFLPLEWKPNKQGGISFTKQSLLEISVVPVPANPNALVQARAAGIKVDRLSFAPKKSSAAEVAARLVEARAIARRGRSIVASIGDGRVPTKNERLIEAQKFRRAALAAGK